MVHGCGYILVGVYYILVGVVYPILLSMSGKRKVGAGQRPSNLQALGISPGEKIPPPILQPPSLFPPHQRKPLQLSKTLHDQVLLAKKQALCLALKESRFYLKKTTSEREYSISRYSDRYRSKPHNELRSILELVPKWRERLPKELHLKTKTGSLVKKPSVTKVVTATTVTPITTSNVTVVLGNLEKQEVKEGQGNAAGSGGEEEDLEEYDEELEEEQGDYQLSYFDPGDEGGVSDEEEDTGHNYY